MVLSLAVPSFLFAQDPTLVDRPVKELITEIKFNDALTPLRDLDASAQSRDIVMDPRAPGFQAHKILKAHLLEIKKSGKMASTIALESYWQDVYTRAGYPDLYRDAAEEVKQAVEAGLELYFEGEDITAEQFATTALKAIEPSDTQIMADSEGVVTYR